ncbi:hypothetical protein GIB67_005113, partial [Kingdonia uniflora]
SHQSNKPTGREPFEPGVANTPLLFGLPQKLTVDLNVISRSNSTFEPTPQIATSQQAGPHSHFNQALLPRMLDFEIDPPAQHGSRRGKHNTFFVDLSDSTTQLSHGRIFKPPPRRLSNPSSSRSPVNRITTSPPATLPAATSADNSTEPMEFGLSSSDSAEWTTPDTCDIFDGHSRHEQPTGPRPTLGPRS